MSYCYNIHVNQSFLPVIIFPFNAIDEIQLRFYTMTSLSTLKNKSPETSEDERGEGSSHVSNNNLSGYVWIDKSDAYEK